MAARIVGIGKYLPQRILTNQDLEKMVETSGEWIVERTGISERRIAADDEGASTMGAEAARMALRTAGLTANDIDLIICATCTPDGMFPSAATLIQEALGARRAAAFDINAVCMGFIAALSTGAQFIESGVYKRVLVVGSEVLSRIVNWNDRATCILFGDGAGAVVLERGASGGAGSFVLKSDGAGARFLYARGPASPPSQIAEAEGFCIAMDGREIFRFAVRSLEEAAREVMALSEMDTDDVSLVIPHQANQRIISAVAKALSFPEERMYSNVARYGNTSSATIPVAMCEAWEEGKLHEGDKLVLVAFGGGLVWGGAMVEWTGIGSSLAKKADAAAKA